MRLLQWTLVLVVAGFLAWRMVVVNLSQLAIKTGGQASASEALAWAPDNPLAQFYAAVDLMDSNPDEAERLLSKAIVNRPADARLMAAYGLLLEQTGRGGRATQAMDYAAQLGPSQTPIQLELAAFWGRRQDLERYLTHLVAAMSLNANTWQKLNPILLAQLEPPGSATVARKVLSQALADRDHRWWPAFFAYAVRHAKNLDVLRLLYSIRRQSSSPPADRERIAFLLRLERAGEWLEAYFIWLNSLGTSALGHMGNLFNGGFEAPLLNEGFGWRTVEHPHVEVDAVATDGVVGRMAMRLSYRKLVNPVVPVSQYLLLPSGPYEFDGRVRVDDLRAEEGVRWQLRCVDERQIIWQSESFKNSMSWRSFGGRFDVPADACMVQQLSMVVASPKNEEWGITGTLWFDDLHIRSLE